MYLSHPAAPILWSEILQLVSCLQSCIRLRCHQDMWGRLRMKDMWGRLRIKDDNTTQVPMVTAQTKPKAAR